MENKNYYANGLQKGAIILVLCTALSKIIGAIFKIPISADYCLGDLGFGYFSTAYDLFIPISMLAMSGFPSAISKLISEYNSIGDYNSVKATLKAAKRVIVGIGVVCFFIMLFVVCPVIYTIDKTKSSLYSLLAIAPCLLLCSISSVYRGYFAGLCDMSPTGVSGIIEALGKLILGFGAAFVAVKLWGNVAIGAAAAMLGITVGYFFSTLYLVILFKKKNVKKTNLAVKDDGSERAIARLLLKTALPVVLISLSASFPVLVDAVSVRWQLGNNTAQDFELIKGMYSSLYEENSQLTNEFLPTVLYGIKAKVYTIYNLVPTFTAMIGVSAVPVISGSLALKDRQAFNKGINTSIKLSGLLTFPAAIGLSAISVRIVCLIYGYTASSEIGGRMLFIYGLAALFSGVSMVLGNILLGASLQKKAMINIIIGFMVKLIFNIVLCSSVRFNIFGSVYATLICYVVIFVLHFLALGSVYPILSGIKVLVKPFFAALFSGAIALLISKISYSSTVTLLAILSAVVVYFTLILILGVIDKEEISAFTIKKGATELKK